jgi:hypothetical protein
MIPTPTEEDLRLAREWLWTEAPAGVWARSEIAARHLAAFRAEARREAFESVTAQRCVPHGPIPPRPDDSCGVCQEIEVAHEWAQWFEKWKAALDLIESARRSEREACERIVEEEAKTWHQEWGADGRVACESILRRFRERAK